MAGPAQVLVVGHDASRTGAPGLALRWVRWAARHDAARTAVWLERGGPLVAGFEAVGPTTVADGAGHRALRLLASGPGGTSAARIGTSAARIGAPRHPFADPPIVLANTVAAWRAGAAVRRRRRLVLWVHELDHVAERIIPAAERARLLEQTDHLIAEGDRVAAMVCDRWHVPAAKVSTVDSFVDPPAPSAPPAGPARADVVAVGSLTARKGPDAFVAVLAALRPARPDVRAAWLGGPAEGPIAQLVHHDLAAGRLTGAVELVGETDDVGSWLHPDAILLHPAREDPAPVAVLDAAVRAMPVITWDTGGAADLLRRAGLGDHVVAAGDVLAMARKARELLDDADARRSSGRALQAAALERTTDRLAPEILAAVIGGAP